MFLQVNQSESDCLKFNLYKIINLKFLKSNNFKNLDSFINSLLVLLETDITILNKKNYIISKLNEYCGFENKNIIEVFSTWNENTDENKYYAFILKIILEYRTNLKLDDIKDISQYLLSIKFGEECKYIDYQHITQLYNMTYDDLLIELFYKIGTLFKHNNSWESISEISADLETDNSIALYLSKNFKLGFQGEYLTLDEIIKNFPDLTVLFIDDIKENFLVNNLNKELEKISSQVNVTSYENKMILCIDQYYSGWKDNINIRIVAYLFAIMYSNTIL